MSVTLASEIEQDISDATALLKQMQELRGKFARRQSEQRPVIFDSEEWGTVHLYPYRFAHNLHPDWLVEQVFTCRRDGEIWYVWLNNSDWMWHAAQEYYVTQTGPVEVWKETKPQILTSLDLEETNETH